MFLERCSTRQAMSETPWVTSDTRSVHQSLVELTSKDNRFYWKWLYYIAIYYGGFCSPRAALQNCVCGVRKTMPKFYAVSKILWKETFFVKRTWLFASFHSKFRPYELRFFASLCRRIQGTILRWIISNKFSSAIFILNILITADAWSVHIGVWANNRCYHAGVVIPSWRVSVQNRSGIFLHISLVQSISCAYRLRNSSDIVIVSRSQTCSTRRKHCSRILCIVLSHAKDGVARIQKTGKDQHCWRGSVQWACFFWSCMVIWDIED